MVILITIDSLYHLLRGETKTTALQTPVAHKSQFTKKTELTKVTHCGNEEEQLLPEKEAYSANIMENQGKKRGKTLFSFFKPSAPPTTTNEVKSPSNIDIEENASSVEIKEIENEEPILKSRRIEIDLNTLERDPGKRKPIWKQNVNQQDEIRRAYIRMGPYQPKLPEYPSTVYGSQTQPRRFQYSWFEKFPWLEYSPDKNSVFCFPCFIFQNKSPLHSALTIDGFNCWKRVNDGVRCPLLMHVGGPTSPHSNAVQCVQELMKVRGHIDKVLNTQSSEEIQKNRL